MPEKSHALHKKTAEHHLREALKEIKMVKPAEHHKTSKSSKMPDGHTHVKGKLCRKKDGEFVRCKKK